MKYGDILWDNLNNYKSILDLPDEIWKPCNMINTHFNEKDLYWVSNYGRCKHNGKYSKVGRWLPPKVLQITDNGNGYKKVALSLNGDTKNFYIHRIVADTFLPNPDNKPQVNHKPSGLGKFDNRVEHLEWCTEKHNITDAHNNGQMLNRSKLTSTTKHPDEFIAEMYRRYKDTGKVGETAREFNVSRTTLSSIVNKRSRTSVTDPIDDEYKHFTQPDIHRKGESNE